MSEQTARARASDADLVRLYEKAVRVAPKLVNSFKLDHFEWLADEFPAFVVEELINGRSPKTDMSYMFIDFVRRALVTRSSAHEKEELTRMKRQFTNMTHLAPAGAHRDPDEARDPYLIREDDAAFAVMPAAFVDHTDVLFRDIMSLTYGQDLCLLLDIYYSGIPMKYIGLATGLTESRVCQVHVAILADLNRKIRRGERPNHQHFDSCVELLSYYPGLSLFALAKVKEIDPSELCFARSARPRIDDVEKFIVPPQQRKSSSMSEKTTDKPNSVQRYDVVVEYMQRHPNITSFRSACRDCGIPDGSSTYVCNAGEAWYASHKLPVPTRQLAKRPPIAPTPATPVSAKPLPPATAAAVKQAEKPLMKPQCVLDYEAVVDYMERHPDITTLSVAAALVKGVDAVNILRTREKAMAWYKEHPEYDISKRVKVGVAPLAAPAPVSAPPPPPPTKPTTAVSEPIVKVSTSGKVKVIVLEGDASEIIRVLTTLGINVKEA